MLIDRLIEPVVGLPRTVKRMIALSVDAGLCVLTVWLAYYLRLGEWVTLSQDGWPAAAASLIIAIPIFVISGLYRAVFRYVGWEALVAICQAIFVYGIIYSAVFTAFGVVGVPRTVGIIQPILLLIAVGASRALGRYWLGGRYRTLLRGPAKNVLIYGAGSAGRHLAAAVGDSSQFRLVGLVDDARDLQGSVIGGIRVWGPGRLPVLVEEGLIDEIFLAIPSASRTRRNEILKHVRTLGLAVRTLPGLLDLAHGRVTVSDLRPLDIDDLLGRDAVPPDIELLHKNIFDKVVLVSGAGGSIGSELCRQILAIGARELLLIDSSEYALYSIHRDLAKIAADSSIKTRIIPFLASVCDRRRITEIFETHRPQTVYHAAAYKHVPLVEHNVVDGVRNNVLGTLICATAAESAGVSSFVLISTDKAVRPTNVMGASKRLAEIILQAIAAKTKQTCFSMVRFGNVLDSSGSVVPLFRSQINGGGPVTVTHREITRYFMTIPEAAQLVLQAGAMADGGEVFILDMGEPVKIFEMAARMIELSGLKVRDEATPDGDIEIVVTGLRPGEKLYEELLIGNSPTATIHPRVMMAAEHFIPWADLRPRLIHLADALEAQNIQAVLDILGELVPEYVRPENVVDWLHVNRSGEENAVKACI